jgi:uncharacterized protein (DUF433 family)
MGDVAILERPLYGFAQVDELLSLVTGTARRWIDGYSRGKRIYPPVVRPESTGNESVTWGEFVETSLLSQYRDVGVPLQRLRPVVQILRQELGVPYPLAHARPWVERRDLVLHVQQLVGLDTELELAYAPRTGQVLLTDRAEAFFQRVQWNGDEAGAFIAAEGSRVILDPLRSFGAPTVDGIRTDVIAELVSAGEAVEWVARVYGLPTQLVDEAIDFERRRAA